MVPDFMVIGGLVVVMFAPFVLWLLWDAGWFDDEWFDDE